jgi:hypothetical protein
MVTGVMGKERREAFSRDLVSRQGVNIIGGNTGTYAVDRSLLRTCRNF